MKFFALCFFAASAFAGSISESTTQGMCRIGESDVAYTAKAGTYTLKNDKDEPQAEIFFTAYTKNDEDVSKRPVTFCFNGGPGSSSIWLHMGALGPKRIVADDLKPQSAPYQYQDNIYSILDVTDLVFVDPVSTGFSRTSKDVSPKQFHGIDADIDSLSEFIRLYVTRNARWKSPKYLAGESYGSTRAAGLVDHLQDRFYMNFNGVILISSALNFRTFDTAEDGNDLPYQMYLPTMTAVAWYHQKLPSHLQEQSLEAVISKSKAFALGPYNRFLAYGHALDSNERQEIAEHLAGFTGLDRELIEEHDLRIPDNVFFNKVLGEPKKRIGRMDGRVIGLKTSSKRSYYIDPSTDSIASVFTAGFNDYVRTELKLATDEQYNVLENVMPWNCLRGNLFGYPATDQDLARAMTRNPKLRAMFACGYYDGATPFFAAEYVVNHLNIDPLLRSNLTTTYYPAGHMMFLHEPSLAKLKSDIAIFIEDNHDP